MSTFSTLQPSIFQLSEMFFLFDFQLSIIEPIKRDVIEARDAMNMGDYPRAIEFLGKAIEVIIILSIISSCLFYNFFNLG